MSNQTAWPVGFDKITAMQNALAIYNEWQDAAKQSPRSEAYKAGLKARLLKCADNKAIPWPSPKMINAKAGTPEYDAFLAGAEHGYLLWINFSNPENCVRRKP